jgi:hypothetical protein
MAVNYSWLQTNVYNIIMDGISIMEEDISNNQSSNINNKAPTKKEDKGTGTKVESTNGLGQSSFGIKGPNAQLKDLSDAALTLKAIDNLVNTSGAQSGGPYESIIRQRIVKIAASYVGLYEALPPKNPGWWDKDYEAKFKKLKAYPWSAPEPWCAWFCQLVWKEAYTVGNALVKSVDDLKYAKEYKNIWDTTLKNGALIGAGVTTCRANFKNIGKLITLDQATSGKSLPEPGDIIVYGGYHVGLVIKPFVTDGKLTGLSSIGGNTGNSDFKNGGETKYFPKDYQWKQATGFCKVITPFNKDVNYAKK